MNRFTLIASAFVLSATLSACASQSETDASASVETPAITMASNTVENAPLPMAIAPATESSPEDGMVLPVGYACQDGRSFIATYPANGKTVTIAAAGETRILAHRGAADTVMFSDGDVTLTAEGAEATLTGIDEPYTACMAG
jgi:membrane-bound inhibitor of C-type lysozyme